VKISSDWAADHRAVLAYWPRCSGIYSDVKTREFLIDKDPEERPGRTATTARSDGGCTTQGSRAPEAPSNDRLCRNQRVSARHDPAVFRRSTGTRAMRDLQQLCRGTLARRRLRRRSRSRVERSVSYAEPDSPGSRGDGRARSADCAHCADHTERSDVAVRPPEEAPASP